MQHQPENGLEALARRAQTGDKDAFAALYAETWRPAYYYALKMLKNEESAKDAVQESFILVYTKISTLREPGAVLSWIYAIVANTCRNMLKKANAFPAAADIDDYAETLQDDDGSFLPEEWLETEETRQRVVAALDQLSPDQREAMLLFYFQNFSVEQIAAATETKQGTVKVRLHRARNQLREILSRDTWKGLGLVVMAQQDVFNQILLADAAVQTESALIGEQIWQAVCVKVPALSTSTTSAAAKSGLSAAAKLWIGTGVAAAVIAVTAFGWLRNSGGIPPETTPPQAAVTTTEAVPPVTTTVTETVPPVTTTVTEPPVTEPPVTTTVTEPPETDPPVTTVYNPRADMEKWLAAYKAQGADADREALDAFNKTYRVVSVGWSHIENFAEYRVYRWTSAEESLLICECIGGADGYGIAYLFGGLDMPVPDSHMFEYWYADNV